MFAFKDEPAVDLVAQYHDISIADDLCDAVDVDLCEHSAGRILRRIQNDQASAIGDEPRELVDIQSKIHFLAQTDRHRFRVEELDHRFVNRKSWVRIDY